MVRRRRDRRSENLQSAGSHMRYRSADWGPRPTTSMRTWRQTRFWSIRRMPVEDASGHRTEGRGCNFRVSDREIVVSEQLDYVIHFGKLFGRVFHIRPDLFIVFAPSGQVVESSRSNCISAGFWFATRSSSPRFTPWYLSPPFFFQLGWTYTVVSM